MRRAVSSAVEHYLDMVGVTSSILVPPTKFDNPPIEWPKRGIRNGFPFLLRAASSGSMRELAVDPIKVLGGLDRRKGTPDGHPRQELADFEGCLGAWLEGPPGGSSCAVIQLAPRSCRMSIDCPVSRASKANGRRLATGDEEARQFRPFAICEFRAAAGLRPVSSGNG